MKEILIELNGVGALLTHNERLANKGDELARDLAAISSKRKKSDDDLAAMAQIEFLGGLYLTDDNRIGLPSWAVFRSIQEGAKLNKLGRHVERALVPIGADVIQLDHDGPSVPNLAWDAGCYDQRSVKVGQAKVTRTRPRFTGWSLVVPFMLDTEVLNLDDLTMCVHNAGRLVGIGDYRPRFGRYEATIKEV